MTRGSYKSSEETKRRLLEAAGELFSEYGVASVSLRQISGRANVAVNAITYHFGGKKELIAAVWDYALRRWDDRRLEAFCAEHEDWSTSRSGQRQLVTGAIAIFYENLYEERQPTWLNRFLFRSFFSGQDVELVSRVFGTQLIDVFYKLYRLVTGSDDRLAALSWILTIIAPGTYLAVAAIDFNTFQPVTALDSTQLTRLCETVTRNALLSVGLGDVD